MFGCTRTQHFLTCLILSSIHKFKIFSDGLSNDNQDVTKEYNALTDTGEHITGLTSVASRAEKTSRTSIAAKMTLVGLLRLAGSLAEYSIYPHTQYTHTHAKINIFTHTNVCALWCTRSNRKLPIHKSAASIYYISSHLKHKLQGTEHLNSFLFSST